MLDSSNTNHFSTEHFEKVRGPKDYTFLNQMPNQAIQVTDCRESFQSFGFSFADGLLDPFVNRQPLMMHLSSI